MKSLRLPTEGQGRLVSGRVVANAAAPLRVDGVAHRARERADSVFERPEVSRSPVVRCSYLLAVSSPGQRRSGAPAWAGRS